MALTGKRQRFIAEYQIDLNATQAAIRAGYSPRSARQIAGELMKNHEIAEAVACAMTERSKRTGISADRVLREIARIGFANASDIVDLERGGLREGIDEDNLAAVSIVKVKGNKDGTNVEREVRMWDKMRALEMLFKHLGMDGKRGDATDDGGGVVELPIIADELAPPENDYE